MDEIVERVARVIRKEIVGCELNSEYVATSEYHISNYMRVARAAIEAAGVVEFGVVLDVMSDHARDTAHAWEEYLGPQNSNLLRAIGLMLRKGAEKCREIKSE